MDDQIELLYQQIKEQKITQEDAVNQLKELREQQKKKIALLHNKKDVNNNTAKVYVYDEPFLRDHTVYGEQVLIGVTYASIAIDFFFKRFPKEISGNLHRLHFIKRVEVKKGQRVEILLEPVQKGSTIDFQVMYRYASSDIWDLTAKGGLKQAFLESKEIDLESIKDTLEEFHDINRIYTANPAVKIGNSFKIITQLYVGTDQALARIVLSQSSREDNHHYILHPLIMNSAYLAVTPLLAKMNRKDVFLPFSIKDIYFKKAPELEYYWLFIRLVKNSGEMIIFDVDVMSDTSEVIAYFSGYSVKRLRPSVDSDEEHQKENQVTSDTNHSEIPETDTNLSVRIRQYLVNKLSKIVDDPLKITNLEINLMDLGVTSNQLVTMANEIEKEVHLELQPTVFFEYPNIKEVTEFFVKEYRDSFTQLMGNDQLKDVTSSKIKQEVLQPDYILGRTPAPLKAITSTEPLRDDIAVIGMHGLFAEAPNLELFWKNLRDKKDVIKEIPIDHWDFRPWYDKDTKAKDKTYCKWGSFIDDVDKFDAGFFNIAPREADWMDPQQRLILQSIYATSEDAGYSSQLRGTNTGVFIGVCCHDYGNLISDIHAPVDPYVGTGNSQTMIANRISFLFDFKGPSIAFDTACSSSLFALHYACQALRNKECDMAFVGGANLLLASWHYRYFCSIGALSPTGRCHTFDKAADGYVPGEGIASILLKPLEQAIRDRDNIVAIIKGSAALHGGYTPSLTAPSVDGQENVILKAWHDAGINPKSITYIEAHGTGTKLGDPIEINSLKKAFKRFTRKEHFCALGSAKAYIGHTEGAAGIAGILKVILQMRHRQIVPLPFFKTLNPYISLDNSPFYINRELEEWKSPAGVPRQAGVSSFGFSGAYAHVIIEEYIPKFNKLSEINTHKNDPSIIILSAKNKERLQERIKQLLGTIREQQLSDTHLPDIAYTLQVGREAMEERLALMVVSIHDLEEKLKGFIQGQKHTPNLYHGQVKSNKETMAAFISDEDMESTIKAWIKKGKYEKILELWVKGFDIDWNMLYGNSRPSRISLPTYPFEKERYWISETCGRGIGTSELKTMKHPLLRQNTSQLSEQRFSCTFEANKDLGESSANSRTLILHPYWKEESITEGAGTPGYAQRLVIFCDLGSLIPEEGSTQMNAVSYLFLESKSTAIAQRFQAYTIQIFEKIQSIIKGIPKENVLIQVVVPFQGEEVLLAGLSGLLKTVRLENPRLIGQLIEVDSREELKGIMEKLEGDSQGPLDKWIRYRDGKRWVRSWREVEVSREEDIPWKDGGIYLITGGVGGLGLIFSREIVRHAKAVTLILTGRSPLRQDKQRQLKELEDLGARIIYKQADVTDKQGMNRLVQSIGEDFGILRGIIHCAGVISDNYILRKSKEELQEVLAPKVMGAVNLDEASKDLSLEFFLLFSSIAGAIGNKGQVDYAVANAFMDAYAVYRNNLVALNRRRGRTLSIDWPLWQEGGMHVDEATEKMLMQRVGMVPLQTARGIQALYQGLNSGHDQVMVITGEVKRLYQALLGGDGPQEVSSASCEGSIPQIDSELLREKTVHQLKLLFGETVKMGVAKIDAEEPLETYGIDSIMINQLNQNLSEIFGELSKTLFYEYQTLESLTDYLVVNHPQGCIQWTGLGGEHQAFSEMSPEGLRNNCEYPALSPFKAGKRVSRSLAIMDFNPQVRGPIAIIGLSGRYPRAKTVEAYWENLKAGRDCIGEIPEGRWREEGFFHPDPQEAVAFNKSYSKWGGFLEGFADFDPLFFNISPREAMSMDPQERLFIESCWEVCEDAGYTKEQLKEQFNGQIGVFAGITKTGFDLYGPDLWKQGEQLFPHTSFSSVANRISYILDLQGPSMPIDTMCSSSLTAIHEACEHLHQGECEMAIAGGVNLYLHPSTYINLCANQMLSADGRCKSFGQGANGFVPGEGVGAILLKPLSRAMKDGDQIYAVIRGSSINHGGKTNGYMVPNPIAQGELIRKALDKAGVNARCVSYVEAHGTGTKLGDPIEISGLTQAFQKDTQDTQFCAIGSVKSNIGHLEAASGIAGVTKIILQMKHQKLVPSLHAEELNAHINFAKTPFVVQRILGEWRRPTLTINGETREYKRIAGISSFGAGGSNAHIVIEEYIPEDRKRTSISISARNPAVILLSAKNEKRLKEYANKLLEFLEKQDSSETETSMLEDVSYTLQVGREAMEERLAMLAVSVKELKEKLKGFVEGRDDIEDVYRGQVKPNKETLAVLTADEELQEALDKWVQRRKYTKIMSLWVRGLRFNWEKLYGDTKPRCISLPTYPFAKGHYWASEFGKQLVGERTEKTGGLYKKIHPLVHQNTSDLTQQRFSSVFTGQEFFLANHIVKGERVMPGMVYLEMACAAVDQSTRQMQGGDTRIGLRNVTWYRPTIIRDQAIQIHISLFPDKKGEILYKIYSEPEETDAEPLVYSEGTAILGSLKAVSPVDIAALKVECSQSSLNATQCYEAMKAMGIDYGSECQGIDKVYVGSDKVLARIYLPPPVSDTQERFILHPTLMDAALQAQVGLFNGCCHSELKPAMPFSLKELEIFNPCPSSMWALIRFSEDHAKDNTMHKIDIDLYDERGMVCIRMKGYCSKAVEGENSKEIIPSMVHNIQSYFTTRAHKVVSEENVRSRRAVQGEMKAMDGLLCKLLWCQFHSLGLGKEKNFVLAELKANSGVWDLYDRWLEASILMLAHHHYLSWDGNSCTVMDPNPPDRDAVWQEWDQQKESWLTNSTLKSHVILVEAMVRALPEILTGKVLATDIMFPHSSMELVEGIFKDNPVADYFNEVIADTVATYLLERRAQDASVRIRILEIGAGTGGTSAMVFSRLQSYHNHIEAYCYTDISKAFLMHGEKVYGAENPYVTYQIFDVERPIGEQNISYGAYDLVIAANVLHATKNMRQTLKNVKAALKKHGLILLNEISQNFLVTHLTFGLLEGWWLYEDPELRIPGCPVLLPETWQKVLEEEGFRSVFFPVPQSHEWGQQIIIAESDGVVHRKQALDSNTMLMNKRFKTKGSQPDGKGKTFQRTITQDNNLTLDKRVTVQECTNMTDQMIEDHIKETIIEKLSESLKVDSGMIDSDESFRDYGLDSITGVHLVQVINQTLMITLETTSLFDYSSVNQLTAYILSQYKDKIITALGQNDKQTDMNGGSAPDNKEKHPLDTYPKRFIKTGIVQENDNKKKEESTQDSIQKDPIAVIGMSARFAKSKDIKELWEHLAKGSDLVEEVTRWDLSQYYLDSSEKEEHYCRHGSFLEDIDKFDPLFFNISGLEATYMDPQHRFFLEESWKALEDAGYAGTAMSKRKCGIYGGCYGGDFQQLLGDNPPAQAWWGNSGSVIPARIAYYLDFHGPAVAIDTACSSSLIAIHFACQSLWTREIEMALAGGVYIQCTPALYLAANRAGVLSPTGRCHTFDDRADGFVPGEGIGVVVLKRLKEAIADGDHIYGVIRGSGMNQDGTTNGITAPSAESQERLECYVYDTFNIHPEQIQMVEAHGTGTRLGDPIEYRALSRAFRKYTDKKEYCAIGSIKSNLGHAAPAAGIAGFIKVLLSLQHKKIPPSLHFQSGNSNIQFKNSPFYVNTALKDWDIEAGAKRCAVISSFGFSGTNAHMVIEEAPELERRHSEKPGYLIVLSGRTSDQLRQQVEHLAGHCEKESHIDCGNMSYTLLLGRKHLNHRLACVVRNHQELAKHLKKWLEKGKVLQMYTSELNDNDYREQPSLKEYGNQCIKECQHIENAREYLERLSTIADLYIQGYRLEFGNLFLDEQYSRISLPTYPFAREHYWVPDSDTKAQETRLIPAFIHPLLHQNTSDLTEQRFSSAFTGKEFFLVDHIVQGQRILPGVALLEMARAAVEQAVGTSEKESIQFRNGVWVNPIKVGKKPVQIHIGLFPEENGSITYEIYSKSKRGKAEREVYSHGQAVLHSISEIPTLDLSTLQSACNQSILTAEQCYKIFQSIGIDYGPAHQGIEKVYVGWEQVLAKISLPFSVSHTRDQFVLHPTLMNAALQASLGLSNDSDNPCMVFPFSLQEMQILGNCTFATWALIRSNNHNQTKGKVQKLDIDMCDDQGKVCVRIKGLFCFSPEFIFLRKSEKPKDVLLRSLSKGQFLTDKPPKQAKQPIALQSLTSITTPGISIPQPMEAQEQAHSIPSSISLRALQEDLCTSLAEALYVKKRDVDIYKKFIDMGMDSIIGVEWINKINQQYGTSILATKVYDYPNILEFSKLLEKELNKQERKMNQGFQKSLSSSTFDDVLVQVHQGTLDIQQAEQLFNNYFLLEEMK